MLTIDLTLGLTSSILSFVFFCLVRYLIHPLTYYRLSPQKPDQRTSTSPKVHTWLTYPNEERWQRLNLLISWIHAVITGVLVLYSFWAYASDLQRDFVHHHSLVTYLTCSFSFGYFCYDLCDVISNRRGSDVFEIVLHHVITLIFFGWNIFQVRNIGYQMFALLAEVNSIFLHARKLLHLFHFPRKKFLVRLNMILNIITFFFFRLCDYYYLFVICILIPIMWIINPILFYRVLYTDFLKRYKSMKFMS